MVGERIVVVTPAELLAFEAAHPTRGTNNDMRLRALGLSTARYLLLLSRAARSAEGIAADPITARRVRDEERAGEVRRWQRMHPGLSPSVRG